MERTNVQLSFDFNSYRTMENVRKMYDLIVSKEEQKSRYIAEAYTVYKRLCDVPEKTLSMTNNINLLKFITRKYDIQKNDSDKIKNILESIDFSNEAVGSEKELENIVIHYDPDDEIGCELFNLFDNMDVSDKVPKLTEILTYYVESGNDKEYLEQESEELLKNLAAYYSHSNNDSTLNEIVRTISIAFDADTLPSYVSIMNKVK